MIFKIFAIHDSKAQAHFPPFYLPTKAMAVRAFADMANDPTNNVGKHPEDYTLFHIGEYDDNTGVIEPLSPTTAINKAVNLVNPELQNQLPHMKAAE